LRHKAQGKRRKGIGCSVAMLPQETQLCKVVILGNEFNEQEFNTTQGGEARISDADVFAKASDTRRANLEE